MYEDVEKIIEKLNKEIIDLKQSKEYQFGYKYEFLKKKLRKFQFADIFNAIRFALLPKIKYNNIMPKYEKNNKSKIVVYTCITGNYDNICEPLYKKKNIEYVMFTNNINIKSNVWDVRPIPKNVKFDDNFMKNRYIKMHPKEIFKDYDYSIYIDGNILVVGDVSEFINTINDKTGISVHRHSDRDCVYDESNACIWNKKGNIKMLKKQIKKYKKEGFPKKYGLAEMNVIVVDLKSKNSLEIMDCWWNEFLKSDGKRDQICFPYVLWKKHYKMADIGFLGNNVYKNLKLQVYKHIAKGK